MQAVIEITEFIDSILYITVKEGVSVLRIDIYFTVVVWIVLHLIIVKQAVTVVKKDEVLMLREAEHKTRKYTEQAHLPPSSET